MARHISVCALCHRYTMADKCPECGAPAVTTQPPKYSPEDKYADYRRRAKRDDIEKAGLI